MARGGPHWDVQRMQRDAVTHMKNIQIIDGALNCTYSIYAAAERDFGQIFPSGSNVAFSDEVAERLGARRTSKLFARLWQRRVEKAKVTGIHGTMFFGLPHKKAYYPNRIEAELRVGLPGPTTAKHTKSRRS